MSCQSTQTEREHSVIRDVCVWVGVCGGGGGGEGTPTYMHSLLRGTDRAIAEVLGVHKSAQPTLQSCPHPYPLAGAAAIVKVLPYLGETSRNRHCMAHHRTIYLHVSVYGERLSLLLTRLRFLKSDLRQKGHCQNPVLSFFIGLALSSTSLVCFFRTMPTTVHTTNFPSRLPGLSPVNNKNLSSPDILAYGLRRSLYGPQSSSRMS